MIQFTYGGSFIVLKRNYITFKSSAEGIYSREKQYKKDLSILLGTMLERLHPDGNKGIYPSKLKHRFAV